MTITRSLAAIVTAVAALSVLPGCAITRKQETVGAYIDDAAITTAIKAKFAENRTVDASSIKVETLNGEVMLSGFAKNYAEKTSAEQIAGDVKGVRAVRNQILVRS